MTDRTEEVREAWDGRSIKLGPTKRAVLFKRFPGWLNEYIHWRHVEFVLRYCPGGRVKILDLGCGYGRISREVAQRRPGVVFQGVDLCNEFALEYRRTVGPCFHGAIQNFHTDQRFDCVLIVTALMYLSEEEQFAVLRNLRSMLEPGATIICIEPASELFVLWRRLTGRASASPTGGAVRHFSMRALQDSLLRLDGARLSGARSVRLLPFASSTSVHHAVAVNIN